MLPTNLMCTCSTDGHTIAKDVATGAPELVTLPVADPIWPDDFTRFPSQINHRDAGLVMGHVPVPTPSALCCSMPAGRACK